MTAALSSLKVGKAPGPDNLHPEFLIHMSSRARPARRYQGLENDQSNRHPEADKPAEEANSYHPVRKAGPQQNFANSWSQIASRTSWIQGWSQHCEPSRLVNWGHRKFLSNPAKSWTSASRPLGCLRCRLAQRINPQATQHDSKQAHGKVHHAACNESPIRPPHWANKI